MKQYVWFEVMKRTRDLNARVLPNRSARHLLLVLSSYANERGTAWPSMTTLARVIGYRLTSEGRLTKSAGASLYRTLGTLKKCGLVSRVDCDCRKDRHACHFQLDLAALWAADPAISPITKTSSSDHEFAITGDNKRGSAADNKRGPVVINNQVIQQPSATPIEHPLNISTSPKGSVESSTRKRIERQDGTPIDAEAIPEAAAEGERDEEA